MDIRRMLVLVVFLVAVSACQKFRSMVVNLTSYEADAAQEDWQPEIKFDATDKARKKIAVGLKKVATGFTLPTDLQFVPGERELALVAEKNGALKWLNINTGKEGVLIKLDVQTASEQGLLGIAYHPQFEKNRKVYLNYVVKEDGKDLTRVAEFEWRKQKKLSLDAFKLQRTIIDVEQPYANHNAGQLAFGRDGYLYIGYGDGGWADDPHGHGQNTQTLLGTMIRIDIDRKDDGKEYGIPKDNPFVGNKKFRPEIWAYGLRNPWRYSFSPDGYLITGDVGQNKWEEISVIEKGGNYGWDIMEAHTCFKSEKCSREGLKLPMLVYGRDDGISITGGYVYYGNAIKALKGKYVFADYGTQRVWAVDAPTEASKNAATKEFYALGNWQMQIATFGQDEKGEIYALDFNKGGIYQIVEK